MNEIPTGVTKDIPDNRNLRFEDVAGAVEAPSWEEGFDLEEVYGPLTMKDQGQSLSCVGQASSYYAEMLNKIEEGKNVPLSARYPYSQIHLPEGTARIADAFKLLISQGIAPEEVCPSYPNDERSFYVLPTEEAKALASTYKAKSYATVAPLLDEVRRAIFSGHGVVTAITGSYAAWHKDPRKGVIHPPLSGEQGFNHCMYLVGYRIMDGVKMVIAKDSYGPYSGDKGRKYIPWEEYFSADFNGSNCLFNLWTLVDLPNKYKSPLMFNLIKGTGPNIYAVKSGSKSLIFNMTTFNEGEKLGLWADISQVNEVTDDVLEGFPETKSILFVDQN
jgi:hypothetical protein